MERFRALRTRRPTDSDGDGFDDSSDPYPNDPTNYSSTNGITWNADVLGDADSDGTPNWQDSDPYGVVDSDADGFPDSTDPFPSDNTNFSSINGMAWMNVLFDDADNDGMVNWQDPWPYDPYNGETPPDPDNDGDGLSASFESTYGTSDADVDTDDDGLTDYEELIVYSTNPLNAYHLSQTLGWGNLYTDYQLVDTTDTDSDTIPDRIETFYGMLPNNPEDGFGDLDGNGMTNAVQYSAGLALNVDLNFYDVDGDGMTDLFEDYYGLNKNSFADAMADADNDGVLNFEEAAILTSPLHPNSRNLEGLTDHYLLAVAMLYPENTPEWADANNNNLPDWYDDALIGASPRFTRVAPGDLDGDGMPDVWEHQFGRWKYPTIGLYVRHNDSVVDPDLDSLTSLHEYQLGTNPLISDSNQDGTTDGQEDFDNDGLSNALEEQIGSSSFLQDTDGDGFADLEEYLTGSNAVLGQSTPLLPDADSEPDPTPLPSQPRPTLLAPIRGTSESPLSVWGDTITDGPLTYVIEGADAFGYFNEWLEVTYDPLGEEISRETVRHGAIEGFVNSEPVSEPHETFASWNTGFDSMTHETNFGPSVVGSSFGLIGSGHSRSVDEDDGTVWWESWAKSQIRLRVRWSQPSTHTRDIWWLVNRFQERWDETDQDYKLVTVATSIEPYVIEEEAEVKTLTSAHWVDKEVESVTATMINPEILTVNDGDADSDGRPDFADGMVDAIDEDENAYNGHYGSIAVGTAAWQNARIRLTYSASPPLGMTEHTSPEGDTRYLPAPGALRVWKPVGGEPRDPRPVMEGGNYIAPNVWISQADLGQPDTGGWSFLVESVALSTSPNDQEILIEVDNDGDGPEQPYLLDKKIYTSLSTTFHSVTAQGIGGREEQLRPSLPNPTIEIANFEVNNARVAQDGSLLVDIVVSATVHSTVCDLTPGEATGAIKSAFMSVNGKVHGQSVKTLSVQKSDVPLGPERPHPYLGTLTHTMTGVPVTEGWNRFVVGVQDPLYHLTGTASVGFEIEASPPVSFGDETAVAIEFPASGSQLQENEARVTLLNGGVTVADDLLLHRVPSQGTFASYQSPPGAERRVVLYFPESPEMDDSLLETTSAVITVYEPNGQSIAHQAPFGRLNESAEASNFFHWSATSTFAPYLGWSVNVGEVAEPEATGGGEFNPTTIRLNGPEAIVSQVAQIHFAGQAMPVVNQGGAFYAANPQNPSVPAVFVSLPIPSVGVPAVEPDQPESGEEDPDWELKEDVPDEHMETVKNGITVGRNLYSQIDADALIQRVTRLAETHLNDQTEWAYYDGFIDGFINNPVSTAEDAWTSICGLTSKAINVATLVSPGRIIWEMTGGDRYEGEIAVAKKTVRGAIVAVDLVKEFAPEAILFLAKLGAQNTEAYLEWRTKGIIPGTQQLGKEQQIAFEVMATLLVMADDAWVGMDTYQRGYWQGYLTFEVMAVVIATVVTAEAGGVGGVAVLARHGPKLVKILTFLEKILAKLDEVPQLARLLATVRQMITGSSKLPGPFCFVKGTPVLTAKGMKPIEQVQAMDWVWSRSEDGSEWDWRPVLGTVVTHPDALAHLRYRVLGGANDVRGPPEGAPINVLAGFSEIGEISGSLEHPFYVQRNAESFAGFVPLREVRVGDVLTMADGREAEVCEYRVEQAVPGTLFTTYNFEVAEYHTYFAGSLPVWVHNMGLTSCNWLEKQIHSILSNHGLTWETSTGQRADILAKDLGDIIEQLRHRTNPTTGEVKAVPARLIRLAMAKICQADYKDYGMPGGHNNLSAFKTVEWWNDLWLKTGLGKGSPVNFQWQVHHLVEDFMLKRLKLSPPGAGNKRNDVPGVVLKGKSSGQDHGPLHKGQDGLATVIYSRIYLPGLEDEDMLKELKKIYTDPDLPFRHLNLWPATRDWLRIELARTDRAHLVPD